MEGTVQNCSNTHCALMKLELERVRGLYNDLVGKLAFATGLQMIPEMVMPVAARDDGDHAEVEEPQAVSAEGLVDLPAALGFSVLDAVAPHYYGESDSPVVAPGAVEGQLAREVSGAVAIPDQVPVVVEEPQGAIGGVEEQGALGAVTPQRGVKRRTGRGDSRYMKYGRLETTYEAVERRELEDGWNTIIRYPVRPIAAAPVDVAPTEEEFLANLPSGSDNEAPQEPLEPSSQGEGHAVSDPSSGYLVLREDIMSTDDPGTEMVACLLCHVIRKGQYREKNLVLHYRQKHGDQIAFRLAPPRSPEY
ncbi:hypothetical protein HDE_01823 [Halotydeus destructor]|nr:hypothetical protein HDE_01823 [Halotydeus destructor]